MANFVPASYSNLKMFQMEKVIKSLILFPKLKLYIYIYINEVLHDLKHR